MGERDVYRHFGRKVADFRHGRDLTQADLARKIGVSRASLANIERGEQRVYLHQLLAIYGALDLKSLTDLLPPAGRAIPPAVPGVTVSGDKLNRKQERTIKELVSSITATSRRAK